jgi:hypothetical protein
MASQSEEMHGQQVCAAEVSPEIVDAGAEMVLRAEVSCTPPCDLRGQSLEVKDQTGVDAGIIDLTEFDGETSTSGTLKVTAPLETGEYSWSTLCPAHSMQDVSYAQTSAVISFTVKPHTIRVLAWDIPTAVVGGEKFKMKIGIKCSSECRFADEEIGIEDFGIYSHDREALATGKISGELWPGTSGLYFTEVELNAPATAGLYNWNVKCPGTDGKIPHTEGTTGFGLRVVNPPECLVSIETIDKESQTPLKGVRVVMHPYAAVSDEYGIAQLRVAKGTYRLFVAQTSYLTFGLPVEVTADMNVKAELDLEPVPERN